VKNKIWNWPSSDRWPSSDKTRYAKMPYEKAKQSEQASERNLVKLRQKYIYIFFLKINVIHHQMSHPHQNDPPEPQLTSYEGDDSEVNHITYLICKVPRSLIL
jgi:hypothetical protein